MKKTNLSIMLAVGIMAVFSGCQEQQVTTGFLSDYSKLQEVSEQTLRYLPAGKLGSYSKFIIEPVVVRFHDKAKGSKISRTDLAHLKQYMFTAVYNAISDRYGVVTNPGPGVARVRVAITDIKGSKTLQNIIPMAKMAGTGLGGASIEAEIVDSQTGKQIGALVETQSGNRFSFDGLSKWGDTEAVMKDWAQRFRKRLDETH